MNALKRWADGHRELIIMFVAIPIGAIANALAGIRILLKSKGRKSNHERRVRRIMSDVRRYADARSAGEAWAQKPLRTDRSGTASLNVRESDKSTSHVVRMQDLDSILSLDREQGIVRLEPFVTVGTIAKYLDKRDLQLEATIEMREATLGGLVMALGLTTHSHVCGLVHDTVTAYEIVDAQGELIRATAENEHADLFRALPWSHGTLGLLVAIEMRIIPVTPYVKMAYRPFYTLDTFTREYERLVKLEAPPHFLETIIFDRDRAVIMEGYLAERAEVKQSDLPVNPIDRYYKPLFYKHAESMLDLGEGKIYEEYVPMYHYLMRHDRSMCMTLAQILPSANNRWFRYLMGWMLPLNMKLLKQSRPKSERINTIRQQVWQDYAFPASHFAEMISFIDQRFGIYPLLIYPCKVIDHGGMIRRPVNRGKYWSGRPETEAFLDIGIFGFPKEIRNGNMRFPTVSKVRELEQKVRSLGGFLHTYCDIFSTEEEFMEMFDHGLWEEMRERYGATGSFPGIYEKIKPEIDPLKFLEEEAAWNEDQLN